jgi:lipid II:glycine glycyltransferase (peptidoglycan interpeptide bridge formation enzyme)
MNSYTSGKALSNASLKMKLFFQADLSFLFSMVRMEKGYSLSMSLQQILEVSRKLPGMYRIFTVCAGEEIIAASIMVVINPAILYNFYPASAEGWKKESPMVFLLSEVYKYCQNHGYGILDLGTSWLNGKSNRSLIDFKENVGGLLSYRRSFIRN